MACRILFLGLDAMDPSLLQRWAGAGELPTLSRLLSQASWGTTRNPEPICSGAVWPSFTTGVSPAQHGRFYRYQTPSGEYVGRHFPPGNLHATPFWNGLSRAGRKALVMDVPHWAISKESSAVQLVSWSSHEPEVPGGVSNPASLIQELRRRFGQPPPDTCDSTPHTASGTRALVDELLRRIDNKRSVCTALLCENDWDFFTVVFGEAHCIGHQCWATHDTTHPSHDPAIAATTGDPLLTVYRALDNALNSLIESAGTDAVVFILASHGMGPEYNESDVLDEALRRFEGVAAPAAGPLHVAIQHRSRRMPRFVRDLKWIRRLRTDVHRRLDARRLEHDRWRRSYFAVPHNHDAGAIRINLIGREHHGRVHPGDEYQAVRTALRDELSRLVNPDTGRPVVRRVLFTSDIFHGPHTEEFPDVFVEWSRQEPVTAIHSPRIGTLKLPAVTGRTGDHSAAGLVIATAKGLPAGRLREAVDVTAFAPTIAHMLGVRLDRLEAAPIAPLLRREPA